MRKVIEAREMFPEGTRFMSFSGKEMVVRGEITFSLFDCCVYCMASRLWDIKTNKWVEIITEVKTVDVATNNS